MKVTLCLIVRNEEQHVVDCLEPIAEAFDDVIVVDTGSNDGTVELIQDRIGIRVHHFPLPDADGFGLLAARNHALELVRTPWALMLDADERIDREALAGLREMQALPGVAGYFSAWQTDIGGGVELDYKLSLFRREVRYRGLIHPNVQPFLREAMVPAEWTDCFAIRHVPHPSALGRRRVERKAVLMRAIQTEPAWLRYYWFLGYSLYREGAHQPAQRYLSHVVKAWSPVFPVETLNSATVLASGLVADGRWTEARALVGDALRFLDSVRDDFEVKINRTLVTWFGNAHAALDMNNPEPLTPPVFIFSH
jgi:glycosyltransferase involved in cell wall biosynthesis